MDIKRTTIRNIEEEKSRYKESLANLSTDTGRLQKELSSVQRELSSVKSDNRVLVEQVTSLTERLVAAEDDRDLRYVLL